MTHTKSLRGQGLGRLQVIEGGRLALHRSKGGEVEVTSYRNREVRSELTFV